MGFFKKPAVAVVLAIIGIVGGLWVVVGYATSVA